MTIKLLKTFSFSIVLCFTSNLFAGESFKIGIAGPHSGAYAAFGEQLWQGASLAAEDINNNGGINGKQIELIKADDACEPKQAVAVANRIVDQEKVIAVVGHFCSSSTMPASVVYADADILMITPASTNVQVTDRKLPTILRTCGRDDQQGIVAAEFIYKTLKAKRVAILHDKGSYGKGLADAMQAHLKKLGGNIVYYEGLTRGEKDFNAIITKLKQVKADALYFGGLHPEAGPLVRQLREQGNSIPFISGDGIVSEDFITAAGGNKMVDGVYMTFGTDPRSMPEGQKIVDRFRALNFEPEGYTLYSYATLQVVAKAIKNVNSTSGAELANWLKNNTVNTVMGPMEWDTKGDLKRSNYVIYRWDSDGKYTKYTQDAQSLLSNKRLS